MDLKPKQQQIAVAALTCLFALVVFNSLRTMGVFGSRPASAKAAAQPQAEEKLLPQLLEEYHKKVLEPEMPFNSPGAPVAAATAEQGYAAQALRDPFKDLLPKPAAASVEALAPEPEPIAPPAPPAPLPPLTIRGKWWGPDGGAAIINGQVYRVGDQVSGVTIRGIDHSGVTVEFAGRTVVLTSSGAVERSGFSPAVH